MLRVPRRAGALLVGLALAAAACSSAQGSPSSKTTLRLGYFPNITHATAVVGVATGIFARDLGPNAMFEAKTFNAGPAAVEALLSGAIDATYIGPNPAINAFVRSHGQAVRIISGATSGGAFFVVRPNVMTAADLKGKKVASPSVGNTQDVALRAWLSSHGLKTTTEGGGDVLVVNQENSQTLETFQSGQIAGAWVPEPWATRLVVQGGGKVLVDERELWPAGKYVTTQLVVATEFLRKHPAVVEALLRGHVEANAFVNEHPSEAQHVVNDQIGRLTSKKLSVDVISKAWANLTFTNDPIASSLARTAASAKSLGFLPSARITGIYGLALLNKVLKATGRPEIVLP
ncbi:MAG: ABC transporter substrate-binding protein [Actinomycetota bacterium]|nr:ABC transporter substrate-binding protein [Actinomycetota bacterium]